MLLKASAEAEGADTTAVPVPAGSALLVYVSSADLPLQRVN